MMKNPHWVGIEPGDIGFDGGVGISGWIIRRATGANGHCWIYHELIDRTADGKDVWLTVEAGPRGGVIYRDRTRQPTKVVRLWNNQLEQRRILDASDACVGAKYGWGEIARIALNLIGIKVNGWKDSKNRMICSNHVATSVIRARKGLYATLPYRPEHIWPQRLAEWCDWVTWHQKVGK